MISPDSIRLELRDYTPTILKLLGNSARLDVKTITKVLYRDETVHNARKTRLMLEQLGEQKTVRWEAGENSKKFWMLFDTISDGKPGYVNEALILSLFTQHKPVLTNLEMTSALFNNADKTTRDRVGSACNKMTKKAIPLLRKEKNNRIVYYALPEFKGRIEDYFITRSQNNEAISRAQINALESTNKMMQQSMLFIRIMAKFNPRALS